ncbi:MAG: rhomboid family intramembrane serine protease [Spirochaetota bacterium]
MNNRSLLRRPFAYRQYNAVLWLVGANVLVYAITNFVPDFLYVLAMNPVETVYGRMFWQPFTYMFVHSPFGWGHILFNMFGLFIFGSNVEQRIGSTEFLVFYLFSGFVAGVLSLGIYWVTGLSQIQLLGASGAVFATLLAYATFFPDSVIFLFAIIPMKAPVLVLGFTALELFRGLTTPGSGVAHLTHLAGFLAAFLYLLVRLNINSIRIFFGRE